MADITMPQLGETVTEGTITKWFKQVGDQVAEDETLFEVSTDKVDSEVPSPAAGYLAEILVQEGETVDVGAKLAVITDAPPDGGGGGGGEAETAEAPAEDAKAAEPEPEPEAEAEPEPAEEPEPAAQAEARAEGQPAEAEQESPQPEQPKAAAPATADRDGDGDGGGGDSRLLSPVVRRLISEHGLDPSTIEGTGAGGRITRSDVLAVIEGDGGRRPAAPAATAAAKTKELASEEAPAAKGRPLQPDRGDVERERAVAAEPGKAPAVVAGDRDEVVPFTNIRRRTAEHMVRSKATSAHTLVVVEVDFDNVEKVRQAEKARFREEEGVSLTYLPFVTRAVVDAIREFPRINASVGDDELIVHHDVHMGYAVDLNFEGLMAPVVHNADGKRLRAIAREVADLADRARTKRLGPDDIAGGTFTITNPGPFGSLLTAPVINQPQIAILSTDGVKKRPVVVELPDGSDAIVVHPVGNLALSFDHRAVDGAYATAFLAKVREILETRDWSTELT